MVEIATFFEEPLPVRGRIGLKHHTGIVIIITTTTTIITSRSIPGGARCDSY